MLGVAENTQGFDDCTGPGCVPGPNGYDVLPNGTKVPKSAGGVKTTEVPTCSWYQEFRDGACKFTTSGTVHTLFQLPGSVVVGLINPKATVLSESMITLSTAISLVAWGGAAYYLYRRFTAK